MKKTNKDSSQFLATIVPFTIAITELHGAGDHLFRAAEYLEKAEKNAEARKIKGVTIDLLSVLTDIENEEPS